MSSLSSIPAPSANNADATRRLALARMLAERCPPDLAQTIMIIGSVSRGYADSFSDIELCFLVNELQPIEFYRAWLRGIGGLVEQEEHAEWSDGCHTKSWHEGIFVEARFQPASALDTRLNRILGAQIDDHWELTEAWHIADAIPLRDDGWLAEWQKRLAGYPEALQAKLIEPILAAWARPHWWPASLANVWPLAERDARLALANSLSWKIECGLRVLFASNMRWEPDYKWLAGESPRLTHAPERLAERVNAVFSSSDARESVVTCLEVLRDILAIVPVRYDVAQAQTQLAEVMDIHHLPPAREIERA